MYLYTCKICDLLKQSQGLHTTVFHFQITPMISRSKIDGLKKFYHMDREDATKYFEIHEEADVRHAQIWREILDKIPAEKQEAAFAAAVESLKAQNMLLDSIQEKYVGMYC